MIHPEEENMQKRILSLLRACGHGYFSHENPSSRQELVLRILKEKEKMTQKELQSSLRISPGTLSEIVTRLHHRGYIQRDRCPEDRRLTVLSLSEKGRRAADELRRLPSSQPVNVLTEEEQRELVRLLEKLLTGLE